MQSKLYLLIGILFVFVICSISVDPQPKKGSDSALELKKKIELRGKNNVRDKDYDQDKDDEVDDEHPGLSSYGHNQYTSYDPPSNNYRTRSRWSPPSSPPPPLPPISSLSPYDDYMDSNDWSRFGFGNSFPTSMSYDNGPTLNNNPACYSLVDQQYPLFSDICGAVPQARYSLPNAFGHRERWQIAQILSGIIGSSTDSACIRSLRLLICPVLFPPCPSRNEPPPVLPCQSFCRAVKARCALPALELLPCEVLPYSSDLCPTSQSYGSFIPPGSFPSIAQPSPMNMGYSSSNFPSLRSFPSLSQGMSPQSVQSGLSPSSLNYYGSGQYGDDSLSPILVDYPPRSFNNDYRQTPRYTPLTRSSNELRPATDVRSSVVKA